MAGNSEVAGALIGRVAFDPQGRRLGRVIAVIHKADGVDALVEGRRWLLHHSYRFAVDDLTWTADGHLVVSALRAERPRAELAVGMDQVSGGKQR